MSNNIEYSYLYNSSEVGMTRDKDIPNRYWCEYPPLWMTANIGEKIVGFRSFFVARSKRYMMFTIELYDSSSQLIKEFNDVFIILDNDDDCQTFINKFKAALDEYADYIDVEYIPLKRHEDTPEEPVIYEGKNYVAFSVPLDNILSADYMKGDGFGFVFHTSVKHSDTKFIITNMNERAKGFLNAQDYESEGPQLSSYNFLIFYNVWDRHSCMIKSSLVNSTMNNYLGYTGVRYNPLRIYKITNNDTRFFIDLYNGHNHRYITALPFDDLECMTLEIVFYFN
jgi:hypothetical protein